MGVERDWSRRCEFAEIVGQVRNSISHSSISAFLSTGIVVGLRSSRLVRSTLRFWSGLHCWFRCSAMGDSYILSSVTSRSTWVLPA